MLTFRRVYFWKILVILICINIITLYFRWRFGALDNKAAPIYVDETEKNIQDIPQSPDDNNMKPGINELLKQVKLVNREQRIHNGHLPGIIAVIVIQVHNKLFYLERLIESLNNVRNVNKTLLILSHSYCDEDINAVIRKIKFAKVMQIFFPYSIQLFKNLYPKKDDNTWSNTLMVQHKLHWWWKGHFVFDKLEIIKNYNGSIIFLEEDRYVTNNFLRVLKVLEKIMSMVTVKCDIISFGTDDLDLNNYKRNKSIAVIKPWDVTDYVAIAFNRSVWNIMMNLSSQYCNFHDYKWVNSLWHLSKYTVRGHFTVISVIDARVFRFDRCREKKTYCNDLEKVETVQAFVNKLKNLTNTHTWIVKQDNRESNNIVSSGGWNDVRYRELCMFYTK